MLCVVQPSKDRFSEVKCPIKKGDIVTWRATVYIYEMICYTFAEFRADMFFQASCFVELPDLSDEALEEERVKQQHEKIYSSIFVEHFNYCALNKLLQKMRMLCVSADLENN